MTYPPTTFRAPWVNEDIELIHRVWGPTVVIAEVGKRMRPKFPLPPSLAAHKIKMATVAEARVRAARMARGEPLDIPSERVVA